MAASTDLIMKLRPHQERSLFAMQSADKGQILVPTGGGKTVIMNQDCLRRLINSDRPMTVVVVAPRILLANQLCEEFIDGLGDQVDYNVLHVHSGETHHESTTKSEQIAVHTGICLVSDTHQLIFTTYHSLHRIVDSGIDIDVAYFDEAHNSVQRSFFISVTAMSDIAKKCYFFTATRRVAVRHDRGMNNQMVYGPILENVPAPELVANGSILSPKILPFETDIVRSKSTAAIVDSETVQGIIAGLDEGHAGKILVAAPTTKILWNMISQTNLLDELQSKGYNILHITSKHGAYVNKTKVNREVFFRTLTKWGQDPSKKFVVFHYSILSEGINVPGLTHTILLRNLNLVEMAQTIGRVIRLDRKDAQDIAEGKILAGACQFYRKPCGYVTVPVHNNHGNATIKRLQKVVDAIFVDGVPVESVVA